MAVKRISQYPEIGLDELDLLDWYLVELADGTFRKVRANPVVVGTSDSSVTVGTGAKTFTTQAGLSWRPGSDLKVVDQSNVDNWMLGTVTAYDGTTLEIDVETISGSGTHDAWTINVSGPAGATGQAGAPGASRAVTVRLVANGNVSLATGLANGQGLDGKTIVTGDSILLARQTNPAENGIRTAPASGAASRHTDFATWAANEGIIVSVSDGEKGAGQVFRSDILPGGTINTTPIVFRHNTPLPAIERTPLPFFENGITEKPLIYYGLDETQSLGPEDIFSRSTTATYVDAAGIIRRAGINVPRFSYHPDTLEPLGFLSEDGRTPWSSNSEDFSHANWVKSEMTVSANAGTGADGAATADKLIPSTNNAQHYVYQDKTVTSNGHNTVSAWLDDLGITKARLWFGKTDGASGFYVDVDLVAGTLGTPVIIGAATVDSVELEYWRAFGLWRVRASGVIGAFTAARFAIYALDANGNDTFAGDGTSGILAWGAIGEPGRGWTTYMGWGGTPIARGRDVHDRNITGLLDGLLGITIYLEFWLNPAANNSQNIQDAMILDTGAATDMLGIRTLASTLFPSFIVYNSNVNTASRALTSTPTIGQKVVIAGTLALNDGRVMGRGENFDITPDTSCSIPAALTHLRFGGNAGSAGNGNVTIARAAVFSRVMTDDELRALCADRAADIESVVFEYGRPRLEMDFVDRLSATRGKVARLAGGKSEQLVIAIGIDSWTALAGRYVEPLAEILTQRLGDAGVGYVSLFPQSTGVASGCARWSEVTTTYSGGTFVAVDAVQTPDRGYATSSTPGAKTAIDLTAAGAHNAARYFYRQSTDGNVRYRFDGGAWNALAQTGGTAYTFVDLTAPGSFTLLEIEDVSGTVHRGGVSFSKTGPGVRIHKIGNSGQQLSDLYAAASWPAQMDALACDAIIMVTGTNDRDSYPGSFFYIYAAGLADRLRLNRPYTEIMLAMSPENGRYDTQPLPMTDFARAGWLVARDKDLMFLDTQYAFGPPTPASVDAYLVKTEWENDNHIAEDSIGSGCMVSILLRGLGMAP